MKFTQKEKDKLIDELSKLYFNKNFGSTSKSDLDTLLFSAYIEHCLDTGMPYDDYSLSKSLGITQTRVRALKERKELKYPRDGFEWEKAFAESVKNAKYDPSDRYVKMIIQDINVMNEVRNFIEVEGWYDECSLNKKLLRIPLDCFVEICYKSEAFDNVFTEDAKKNVREISKSKEAPVKSFLEDFSKDGLKAFLMSASKEVLSEVLKLLPFGGIAKTAFDFLLRAIEKS